MSTILERLTAQLAYWHAQRVYRRFRHALRDPRAAQERALGRALAVVRDSAFGRGLALARVRSVDDFRRAVPLQRYDDLRAAIERVCDGDIGALLSPAQRPLMFATTSGTTSAAKYIPVTPAFVADYRSGWNTFGLKMLSDHRGAILRSILQSTGRMNESRTASGVPCGAITGLMARMQKGIVRRYYVGGPELADLVDPRARYYALMRLGVLRDVAFAITANPATLIQLARVADEESERLIRDVRDGTLSSDLIAEPRVRAALAPRLRPNAARAAELDALRRRHGVLRPRDYWRIEFLACWTGGSLRHYLPRLAEWWGAAPVRDIGLLASEGRVTIPLADGTPAGVLDVVHSFFEFIPVEHATAAAPPTLLLDELEPGHDYAVVLSNTSGLLRYRLDDVVHVHRGVERVPQVEFLYRAGRVSSVAGEKLTENQIVAAMSAAQASLGLAGVDFVAAPCWGDPPFYRVSVFGTVPTALAAALDQALRSANGEYDSRRKSMRLEALTVRSCPVEALQAIDQRLLAERRSSIEQYKRPCLLTRVGADDELLAPPA
ncbi:MAG: GH3 auxin-responsive promoter family protein [Phycisphaerae bacterium]